MAKYIGKRLLALIPVLLVVSFITFILGSLSSGDTARILAEKEFDRPTFVQIEAMRVKMGFDRPVLVQYGDWLGNVVRGDLGYSYVNDNSVLSEIAHYFPKTLELALLAMLLLILIAFTLGILSAVFPGSWVDKLSSGYCFFCVSIPEFWIGLLLLYFFGARLGMVSVIGDSKETVPVLPVITMAVCSAGIYVRLVRTSMEEALNRGYIRAVRAKGVPEFWVVVKHALKNAVLPMINKLGMGFGHFLAGSAIIESIFSWNGLGKYALESIKMKDYPVIQGYVLFMALLMVCINLAVDIICSMIDPRIKTE